MTSPQPRFTTATRRCAFLTALLLSATAIRLAQAEPALLASLSTRALCQTHDAVLVHEFIAQGTGTMLFRGIGPSLADFGVLDPLQDPTVSLFDTNGVRLDANNDWVRSPDRQAISGSGFAPTYPHESALIDTLAPGLYTFVEEGVRRTQGEAVPEIYDLSGGTLQLSAVGTRGFVSVADQVMISGFILIGDEPASLLIRALGPSLADAHVKRVLPDPYLELHDFSGTLIFSNDNWKDTQQHEIEATGLAPSDDLESAMVVTLSPGLYTMILVGAGGTTGVGFLQIYALDLPVQELDPAPIIRGRR